MSELWSDQERIEEAQARLSQQPFSALLDAQIVAVGDGYCEMRIPIRKDLMQQYHFVHGGVISYAADNTLTIAAQRALHQPVVTSEFKINYLRPAIGDFLIAKAHCVHAGKRQAVSRCEIYVNKDGQEKLCAIAQGTIMVLEAKD